VRIRCVPGTRTERFVCVRDRERGRLPLDVKWRSPNGEVLFGGHATHVGGEFGVTVQGQQGRRVSPSGRMQGFGSKPSASMLSRLTSKTMLAVLGSLAVLLLLAGGYVMNSKVLKHGLCY
jgi:hypothetical protein